MRKAGEEQKRRPKFKDKEETPISSQLVAINPAGIAALVDGTYWRIAPGDLARAKKWIPGTVITVTPSEDRKSTRLNSSHANISYAVFCLKKKKKDDSSILA